MKYTNRYFIAECEIRKGKEILAEGTIKYLLLPDEKITDASYEDEMCYEIADTIQEIDL